MQVSELRAEVSAQSSVLQATDSGRATAYPSRRLKEDWAQNRVSKNGKSELQSATVFELHLRHLY